MTEPATVLPLELGGRPTDVRRLLDGLQQLAGVRIVDVHRIEEPAVWQRVEHHRHMIGSARRNDRTLRVLVRSTAVDAEMERLVRPTAVEGDVEVFGCAGRRTEGDHARPALVGERRHPDLDRRAAPIGRKKRRPEIDAARVPARSIESYCAIFLVD